MTPSSAGMPAGRLPACVPARGAVWTERTVAWYERANAAGDYADRVLAAVDDRLAGCRSALDVGAGFGALALPLARRLDRVTALEPSPPMAAALRRAARRQGQENLTVIEAAWGGAPVGPHDLVVCAHVGPLLRPGSPFLAAAGRLAATGVVLVHDVPGGDDRFFFSELYPLVLGRPYQRCATGAEVLEALADLGVVPAVATVEYRSDQPFESLDEAVEFWTTHLGRDDAEARRLLRDFLARRLVRAGAGWLAPYRKRAAVVWWRTGDDRRSG